MPDKATHSGTCQACGRFQKLPANRLSKHGYTVQWGFFQGTCPGADHQPYELSCEDIKNTYLPSAQRRLEDAKATVAKLRIPTTSNEVRFERYESTKYEAKSKSEQGTLVHEKHPEYDWNDFFIVDKAGIKYEVVSSYFRRELVSYPIPSNSYRMTALDVINHNRKAQADSIERGEISQLNSYIKWQSDRVANWKLAPLTETPDDYVSPEKKAFHSSRALATAKIKAKSTFSRLADRIQNVVGIEHSTCCITAANVLKYVANARPQVADHPAKLAALGELEASFHAFKAAQKAQEDDKAAKIASPEASNAICNA